MARAVWSGFLGLEDRPISFPVKLVKAVEKRDIGFHLLHSCGGRIKYLYHCPNCEAVVNREELKKGYEYAKDQHIILEESDFDNLPLKTAKEINIIGFTDQEIPPILYENHFYLCPDDKVKGDKGLRIFWLLYQVMDCLKVKAIGKVALREGREHLCLIYPYNSVLVLHTLYYADEVREIPQIKKVALGQKELQLGEALIKEMIGIFDHQAFTDEYRDALEKLIEAKIEGKELKPVEVKEIIGDLEDLLLKSLAKKGGK